MTTILKTGNSTVSPGYGAVPTTATPLSGQFLTSTGISTSNARFYQTENNVPDESAVSSVYPNPFTNAFTLGYTAGSLDEKVNIQVQVVGLKKLYRWA